LGFDADLGSEIQDAGWKKVGPGIQDKHPPGSATLFVRPYLVMLIKIYKKIFSIK
jgi:hypothetical protein